MAGLSSVARLDVSRAGTGRRAMRELRRGACEADGGGEAGDSGAGFAAGESVIVEGEVERAQERGGCELWG